MKQLNPIQLSQVRGGNKGSGGGGGVIPPTPEDTSADLLVRKSAETKGSGGGGGVIPPTAP